MSQTPKLDPQGYKKGHRERRPSMEALLYLDSENPSMITNPKDIKRLYKFKNSLEGILFSARRHIGKRIDSGEMFQSKDNARTIKEATIAAGLGYFGFKAVSPNPQTLDDYIRGFGGALTANIGLKLATAFGGTPPVSQIAGLAILGSIGVLDIIGSIGGPGPKLTGNGTYNTSVTFLHNGKPIANNTIVIITDPFSKSNPLNCDSTGTVYLNSVGPGPWQFSVSPTVFAFPVNGYFDPSKQGSFTFNV